MNRIRWLAVKKKWWRRAMKPSDIPRAIANSAVLGVLLGPFIGLLIQWVGGLDTRAFQRDPVGWMLRGAVIGAVYSVAFYITTGMPWVWLRGVVERMPARGAWMFAMGVCAIGGSAGAMLALFVLEVTGLQGPMPEHWYVRILLIDSLIAVAIGIFMAIYHNTLQEAEIRERRLAEAAARAQTFALQAQIAPHFFFNTLNSISALVTVDPAGAQAMIGRLAGMFRYTLASGREELVPLTRELEFVSEYLALEHVRYGDRLRYALPVRVPEDLRLPPLTLQPLVENAIRYGLARRLDGGEIRIDIAENGAGWRIRVENDFDPAEPPEFTEPVFRDGHSLANVRERLRLAFGPAAGIAFSTAGTERFCADMTIPAEAYAHTHRR